MDRALGTAAMDHAGLLAPLDPRVWTIPWNVHRQAQHHGHAAGTSRAPAGCSGAIAHSRRVARTGRTGPCPCRTPGRARPRTTSLDALECLRRGLPPVLPDGCVNVRPGGLRQASWGLPPATRRLLSAPAHPSAGQPRRIVPPQPCVVRCPTWATPLCVGMRLWTSHRAWGDPGGAGARGPDDREPGRWAHTTAPVRPQHGSRPRGTADDGLKTTPKDAKPFPLAPAAALMARLPPGVRGTAHHLPGRHTL